MRKTQKILKGVGNGTGSQSDRNENIAKSSNEFQLMLKQGFVVESREGIPGLCLGIRIAYEQKQVMK